MRVLFSHGNINGIASLHINIFAAMIPFKAGELHLKIATIISIGFKDHQPQLDFLSAISSVVVVFLELETLHDQQAVQMLSVLHNSGPSGIILAIDALKHDMPTIFRLCKEYVGQFL
jgi:NAD/NADP transhydrogenase beta subunit